MSIIASGDTLYFSGYDQQHGLELWQLPIGDTPRLVADINLMPVLSVNDGYNAARHSAMLGQDLVFSGTTEHLNHNAAGFWRAGPSGVANLGGEVSGLHAFNGGIVYGLGSPVGFALWQMRADGSSQQINNTPGGVSIFDPRGFQEIGSHLIFSAASSDSAVRGIWRLDSNSAVELVYRPDTFFSGVFYSNDPVVHNGFVYYKENFSGTAATIIGVGASGTAVVLNDVETGFLEYDGVTQLSRTMVSFDGELYFSSSQPHDVARNFELWKIDRNNNVVQVADINPYFPGSFPAGFTEFNGELYFRATGPVGGRELWKVSASGSVEQVADIFTGGGWSSPFGFTEHAGELYFSADSFDSGRELWKLRADGSVVLVAELRSGEVGSDPFYLHEFAGNLYFRAHTAVGNQSELWRVDENGSVHRVTWPGTVDGVIVPLTGGVDPSYNGVDGVEELTGTDWYIGEAHGRLLVATGGAFGVSFVTIDAAGVVRPGVAGDTFSSQPLDFLDLPPVGLFTALSDFVALTAGGGTYYALSGNDIVLGAVSADTAYGAAGFDSLYGGGGNDSLYGGVNEDIIVGDAGDDQLFGGDGGDVLSELFDSLGSGNDVLDGGLGGDIIYAAAGNDTVYGGTDVANNYADLGVGDDGFTGAGGTDVVVGGAGFDTIYGGIGDDSLYGEADADQLFGGDGIDLLSGSAGNDSLDGGNDNDLLIGDFGNDRLLGGGGIDVLFGFADDDTLNGGIGGDVDALYGGAGHDTFQVGGTDFGYDYIYDFAGGPGASDTIALQSGATITTQYSYAGNYYIDLTNGSHVVVVGVGSVLAEDILLNGF